MMRTKLRRLLLAAAVTVFYLIVSIAPAQALPMFKYGIIDTSGREVLPCKYGHVTYLGNGLFSAEEFIDAGDTGVPSPHLFDSNGKEIEIKVTAGCRLLGLFIPRRALMSSAYVPGTIPAGSLLEVHYSGYQTLADRQGKLLFEQPSLTIQHTEDGSLVVMGAAVPICAFDGETGEKIIEATKLKHYMLSQSGFGKLSQNRILFSKSVDGHLLWGYYDAEGNVAIEPKYTEARDFDEAGMAAVRYRDAEEKGRFCFIDTDGKALSPPEIVGAQDWHEELAVVTVLSGENEKRYGIVNRKFEFVVKPEWKSLTYEKDDRYHGWIKAADKSWIINSKGERLMGPVLKLTAYDPARMIMLYQPSHLDGFDQVPAKLTHENGEVLFSDPHFEACWLKHGIAVFREKTYGRRLGINNFTIVTNKGVTASGIKAFTLTSATEDRLIKLIVDDQFSNLAWQRNANGRMYLFSLFLQSHNLIGMQRPVVEKMFGPADDRNFYAMCNSMIVDFGHGVELRYQDDIVTGWRWVEHIDKHTKYYPWVTTNVTFECDPFEWQAPNAGDLKALKLTAK